MYLLIPYKSVGIVYEARLIFKTVFLKYSSLYRCNRQECCTTCTILRKEAYPFFSGFLIVYNKILHCAAQCCFNCHTASAVGFYALRHCSMYAGRLTALGSQDCLNTSRKTFHVLLHIRKKLLSLLLFTYGKGYLIPLGTKCVRLT